MPQLKRRSRVKQPSTHAGIAAIAALVASFIPPQYAWAAQLVTVVAGSAAILISDQPARETEAP